MTKSIAIAGSVLVILTAVIVWQQVTEPTTRQAPAIRHVPDLSESEPVIETLDLEEFNNDFSRNQVAAMAKYHNRRLRFSSLLYGAEMTDSGVVKVGIIAPPIVCTMRTNQNNVFIRNKANELRATLVGTFVRQGKTFEFGDCVVEQYGRY